MHSEWTLLALGADAPETARFETTARQAGLDLRVLRLPQPTLRTLYEAPLVLIRPDQIVAWRGHDAQGAQAVWRQVMGWG